MIDSEFQATSSESEHFPWPPRENDSVLDALARTWKDSVFQPKSFFASMPREYDFGWVLAYYLLIGVVTAGISLFWHMVFGPSLLERVLLRDEVQPGNPFMDFLLSPLWLLIGLFLIAGVIHVCLLLVRGARHSFGTTLRVLCFSGGPQLFGVVPFIGPAVGGIWALVITVIGLREAHETTTGRALAGLLIPLGFFIILLVLVMMAAFVMGLGGVQI